MEHIFIVVYRVHKDAKWSALSSGEFEERRLAENLIEIKKAQGCNWEFGIVDGPITLTETIEMNYKPIPVPADDDIPFLLQVGNNS